MNPIQPKIQNPPMLFDCTSYIPWCYSLIFHCIANKALIYFFIFVSTYCGRARTQRTEGARFMYIRIIQKIVLKFMLSQNYNFNLDNHSLFDFSDVTDVWMSFLSYDDFFATLIVFLVFHPFSSFLIITLLWLGVFWYFCVWGYSHID